MLFLHSVLISLMQGVVYSMPPLLGVLVQAPEVLGGALAPPSG